MIRKYRNYFRDLMSKEERVSGEEEDKNEKILRLLTRLTTLKLRWLTGIYQYKLVLRVTASLMYTHNLYGNIASKTSVNWVFVSLTLISVLLSLVGGLLFLFFAYVLKMAMIEKSLFESGILVLEEPENS